MTMVSGTVEIGPIWRALGREKAAALPIFHAFTGADNIGQFSGVGKTRWFQHYIKAERDVVSALMKLPEDGDLTHEVLETLASFVCLAYCPKGTLHFVTLLNDRTMCNRTQICNSNLLHEEKRSKRYQSKRY
ncbi:hypothetical protein DPMN_134468 [Dreissena polymorpha]|uniref:Uncharacterized protein n=1 Tax=Dreissena polymorpha TaxID=45954 RepID=A0A9D4FW94_DREPO|nr:hypothetical protein DPMN_134468 [Dreissena polymorpha]